MNSTEPHLHVYAPPAIARFVRVGACPDCKRRTRFLGWEYEWYGTTQVCLRCGRRWADGEWMALPSLRYARRQSIDGAKRRWRSETAPVIRVKPGDAR